MVKYIKAQSGMKFALTEFGLEQAHVRAKYKQDYSARKQYETSVPSAWIEKGYVQEVVNG